jgi:hypothetical protein
MKPGRAMNGIVLSYRREDTITFTGRLRDRLAASFGGGQVFMDITSIPYGPDFKKQIEETLSSCDILIAVMGKRWLAATDGKRRIDDPEDFVRLELKVALRRKICVIPVLVNGARMPLKKELPKELASLCRRNAMEIGDKTFEAGVHELIETIKNQRRHSPARRILRIAVPAL